MDVEASIVREAFRQAFAAAEPRAVYRAPGRVNLIGEHTDYNLGFVCPIAIQLACFVAAGPSPDGKLRVFSKNAEEFREWTIEELRAARPAGHWSDYIVGVAQQLAAAGYAAPALNLAIYSTVPIGAGLSSSAALEVSSALAMLDGRDVDGLELAKLCQRAEREFAGVPCGIMDQYVSVSGEEGRALQIDCRQLTHEAFSLPGGASIIVVNSMVKHELGVSAYRTRVEECSQALAAIQRVYPDVQSLRDVPSSLLEVVREQMPATAFLRARHVTTENDRVEEFRHAAEQGDLLRMGRLFLASHRSLQHDYAVSSEELDFLVDTASGFSGVFGSRMTGGGFGGCTVNLVSPDRVAAFESYIAEAYWREFATHAQTHHCEPSAGANHRPG